MSFHWPSSAHLPGTREDTVDQPAHIKTSGGTYRTVACFYGRADRIRTCADSRAPHPAAVNPYAHRARNPKTPRYLIADYGITKGIAAYNFGAGNVERTPQKSKRPSETKKYVASVIAEYDHLQHAAALAASTPTPSPAPVITGSTPRFSRVNFGGVFGRRDDPCPDRGVVPFLGIAGVADGPTAADAIRHGAICCGRDKVNPLPPR